MLQKKTDISINGLIVSAFVFMNAIILKTAYTENEKHYWMLLVSIPALILAIWDTGKENSRI